MSDNKKQLSQEEQQVIIKRFQSMMQEIEQMRIKVGELDSELNEYRLLLDTLSPMNKDRRCWRLIGGVLVERTVGNLEPVIETNRKGIEDVMKALTDDLQKREKVLKEYQKEHNIKITTPEEVARMQQQAASRAQKEAEDSTKAEAPSNAGLLA
eukprot:GCRY01001008.1.p1 GENE.GCRY01001008.1~~GCRY01001008.1.p1  ORF type:complete len:154 (+),score=18.04 GCRY01001008.1:123-584(+)